MIIICGKCKNDRNVKESNAIFNTIRCLTLITAKHDDAQFISNSLRCKINLNFLLQFNNNIYGDLRKLSNYLQNKSNDMIFICTNQMCWLGVVPLGG